jgi:hypothetical protein
MRPDGREATDINAMHNESTPRIPIVRPGNQRVDQEAARIYDRIHFSSLRFSDHPVSLDLPAFSEHTLLDVQSCTSLDLAHVQWSEMEQTYFSQDSNQNQVK